MPDKGVYRHEIDRMALGCSSYSWIDWVFWAEDKRFYDAKERGGRRTNEKFDSIDTN